jgi:DNA polymerase-3 subunit epsilon
MRQVFLDTETTGLSPAAGDRIIEVGCIEMIDRVVTGRHLHLYVNPQRPSHPDALRIHGLTDEFLSDKPVFSDVVDGLMEFVAGAEILIHNANFDLSFLDEELRRLGLPKFRQGVAQITDSLTMAREAFPGKSNSLDALCKRLEVDNRHRTTHGALLDAGLLAEVYVRMTRGQKALVVEAEPVPTESPQVDTKDLRGYSPAIVAACGIELTNHEILISDLSCACKGGAIWEPSVPKS